MFLGNILCGNVSHVRFVDYYSDKLKYHCPDPTKGVKGHCQGVKSGKVETTEVLKHHCIQCVRSLVLGFPKTNQPKIISSEKGS